VAKAFPESKEFHTLRVQPAPGNYYTTDMLRKLGDSWEKYGSGLITFHGQTGNIMFIGVTTENTQHFFDEINEYGFDLGGAGPACAPACPAWARPAASSPAATSTHSSHLLNNASPTTCIVRHCPTSSSSRSPAAPTTARTPSSARTSP
jgi:dissimilatory sulfite reductase alpha subunit